MAEIADPNYVGDIQAGQRLDTELDADTFLAHLAPREPEVRRRHAAGERCFVLMLILAGGAICTVEDAASAAENPYIKSMRSEQSRQKLSSMLQDYDMNKGYVVAAFYITKPGDNRVVVREIYWE